tara:strand:- start:682 stop:1626 length:945 start_codon:yes stop_codon:yes gene_type:complete
MDIMTLLWTCLGFGFASYTVIANDSIQTLGTWIQSNKDKFDWTTLWLGASSVLLFALWYGWTVNGGDISYGRLDRIPYLEPQWYHALAPGILLVLTRFGIPVSTSFLVLSAFASTFVLEKMLVKSFAGYGVAAVSAYAIWAVVSKYMQNINIRGSEENWRIAQWTVTGWLWWTWLSHDMANMAVFLPREVDALTLACISVLFIAGMGFMFKEQGGKIQAVVQSKTDTNYVKSATLIDLVYLIILWYFKQYNNIPMSTTWVFIGLLSGRELAIATFNGGSKNFREVFPIIAGDFGKLMVGVAASMGIILAIHTFT